MRLGSYTRPELIFPDLGLDSREDLLRYVADGVAAAGGVADGTHIYDELVEREKLGSTGIGGGVAIPHCKAKGLEKVVLAVAVTQRGIDFDATDGQPVRLFFVVISPQDDPTAHLRTLAAISKWIQESGDIERVLETHSADQIFSILDQETEP